MSIPSVHRPMGLALVTKRLYRWRDGPVVVVFLWRAGPRILIVLAHRSGRMRAQYNTCREHTSSAVAGPPLSKGERKIKHGRLPLAIEPGNHA